MSRRSFSSMASTLVRYDVILRLMLSLNTDFLRLLPAFANGKVPSVSKSCATLDHVLRQTANTSVHRTNKLTSLSTAP